MKGLLAYEVFCVTIVPPHCSVYLKKTQNVGLFSFFSLCPDKFLDLGKATRPHEAVT